MTLLNELETAGFSLGVDGDRLTVSPKSKLTPALRALIGEKKAELLAALLGKAPTPAPTVRPGAEPTVQRTPDRPYLGGPFDPTSHRSNLERFWQESGWRPVGGWKPGDRGSGGIESQPAAGGAS